MIAMKRLIDPVGAARDDYDIFAGIAQQLGSQMRLPKGAAAANGWPFSTKTTRSALEAQGARRAGISRHSGERGELVLPTKADDGGPAHAFRADPGGRAAADTIGKDRDLLQDRGELWL